MAAISSMERWVKLGMAFIIAFVIASVGLCSENFFASSRDCAMKNICFAKINSGFCAIEKKSSDWLKSLVNAFLKKLLSLD